MERMLRGTVQARLESHIEDVSVCLNTGRTYTLLIYHIVSYFLLAKRQLATDLWFKRREVAEDWHLADSLTNGCSVWPVSVPSSSHGKKADCCLDVGLFTAAHILLYNAESSDILPLGQMMWTLTSWQTPYFLARNPLIPLLGLLYISVERHSEKLSAPQHLPLLYLSSWGPLTRHCCCWKASWGCLSNSCLVSHAFLWQDGPSAALRGTVEKRSKWKRQAEHILKE